MKYQCKITVLEAKTFPEYQEKYLADPKAGVCPYFKAGDTFLLDQPLETDESGQLMNGAFCSEAWYSVVRYVNHALQGEPVVEGWTNDDRMMIACCTDGTRPVIFKVERIDIPENADDEEQLAKQS
ncbi:MAG: TIGR04076 family protein [Oscillospiraceae bacterium]|nr:TIGR04076 family protein [Oscillospiraceae bacterium]